mmetsp:Transcript_16308/g.40196  ORF Transcript_16308/g.40196 Transcript_16308/m.40196 type:complete len:102 (-) Transcript_16308:223-528(-)
MCSRHHIPLREDKNISAPSHIERKSPVQLHRFVEILFVIETDFHSASQMFNKHIVDYISHLRVAGRRVMKTIVPVFLSLSFIQREIGKLQSEVNDCGFLGR